MMKRKSLAALLITVLLCTQFAFTGSAQSAGITYDNSIAGAIDPADWQDSTNISDGAFNAPANTDREVSVTSKQSFDLGEKWTAAINVAPATNINNMSGQPFGVKVGDAEAVIFNRTGRESVAEKNAHISLIIGGQTVADHDLGAGVGSGDSFVDFTGELKMSYKSGQFTVSHKGIEVITYTDNELDFSNVAITLRTAGNWTAKLNKITACNVDNGYGEKLEGETGLSFNDDGTWTGDTDKFLDGVFTCADFGTYTVNTTRYYDLSGDFSIRAALSMRFDYNNYTDETHSITIEGEEDVLELRVKNDLTQNGGKYYDMYLLYNGEVIATKHLDGGDTFKIEVRNGELTLGFPGRMDTDPNYLHHTPQKITRVSDGELVYKFDMPLDLSRSRVGCKITGNYQSKGRCWSGITIAPLEEGDMVITDDPDSTGGEVLYAYTDLEDGTIRLENIYHYENYQKTHITIPSTVAGKKVTQLGEYLIASRVLYRAVIPDGVTYIEDYAFRNCQALTEVVVPASVKELRANQFYRLYEIRTLTIAQDNPYYKTVDDIVYTADGKTIFFVNHTEESLAMTEYTIPEGVEKIESWAFAEFTNLKTVNFASTVRTVEYHAFYNCTSIVSVVLNEGVTYLGGAFENCTALKSVYLPEGLSSMAWEFRNCTSLESITVPASVQAIYESTFSGCTSLKEITFKGDPELKFVYFYDLPIERVYGIEGSLCCQKVAQESGATFIAIDKAAVDGDASGDFVVDSADILAMEQAVLGLSELDEDAITALDLDNSGTVGAADILTLKMYVLGLREQLR